jgi:subtilase family serine protease
VCGFKPAQLQGAYGLSSHIAAGDDGNGVKVAIVDAYASPTLFADAHEYSERNQPGEPLESSQFSESLSRNFTELEACEANEWSVEQTLDVESVHALAPGADLVFVGARSCTNEDLDAAVQKVVDGHLAPTNRRRELPHARTPRPPKTTPLLPQPTWGKTVIATGEFR